jgi:hypothetical protein
MSQAAHPDQVLPASMSEVVGNDGMESSIEDLTSSFKEIVGKDEEKEPGVLNQLWQGVLDDILGPKKTKA